MNELVRLSATEVASLLQSRKLSSLELVDACLAQIDRLDPKLKAFITVREKEARQEARAADDQGGGKERGALHGIPVAVKDIISTAGIRTTYGSAEFADHVPDADASSVARLKEAGAIVIGKTSTPEFGAYMNTRNVFVGTTLNAWDSAWSSGGSSGGTAVAVATGMAPLGLGTDLGGSVRHPAAFNGIAALRPTPGLVPAWPSSWPYDSFGVTGPMCRTVADLDLMMRVLGQPDPRSALAPLPSYRGPSGERADGLRIGWTEDLGGLFPVDAAVRIVMQKARERISSLGFNITDASPDFSGIEKSIVPLRMVRALIQHNSRLSRVDHLENKLLARLLDESKGKTLSDVAAAEIARSNVWQSVSTFFQNFDVLALPISQMVGFRPNQDTASEIEGKPVASVLDSALSTYAITMLGVPAMCIPCGFSDDGRPIGLQLVAAPGQDARLIGLGMFLEKSLGWTDIFPPVALETPQDRDTQQHSAKIATE